MRKFKAWHKGSNEWLPDDFNKQLFLAQDGTVYWLAYDGLSDVTKAFDIVFCTGLKDKNGIEIYQGDIVLMPNVNKEKYEVYWSTLGIPHWGLAHMDKMAATTLNTGMNGDALEVVGNMHELVKS